MHGSLRTLVDLAAAVAQRDLDDAVDRGLATRLVTVKGLYQEIDRLANHGRDGVGVLRRALNRRGYLQPPSPSVLESRTLRLLARGGIRPQGVEVRVMEDRFRLDIVLAPGLAMEVDGFSYHFTPEAMTGDHHRRNSLQQHGWTVLVFTWMDVMSDGAAVLRVVRAALDQRQQRGLGHGEVSEGRGRGPRGESGGRPQSG